jgi:hypothetical protein
VLLALVMWVGAALHRLTVAAAAALALGRAALQGRLFLGKNMPEFDESIDLMFKKGFC